MNRAVRAGVPGKGHLGKDLKEMGQRFLLLSSIWGTVVRAEGTASAKIWRQGAARSWALLRHKEKEATSQGPQGA